MPKISDRPLLPIGGVALRKKREHEVVVINKTPKPGTDARNPATMNPPERIELTNPETLVIDINPASDGIRYDIVNMGGVYHYLVILTHNDEVFGHTSDKHNGFVPVPDISSRTGTWKGLLIVDGETVADTVEFELDLTVQWLVEEMGKVDIRLGETDGMIDRLGSIRVDPWPKQDRTFVSADREDIAICILFPDLPDRMPDPAPEFTIQIDRPGEGGIYFRDTSPLAEVAGYRMKIGKYLPSTEPGDWHITVMIEDKVLGRIALRITGSSESMASEIENPVEEISVNIVG